MADPQYTIPDQLPESSLFRMGNRMPAEITGMIIALILGYVIFHVKQQIYIYVIYDGAVAFLLIKGMSLSSRFSNYFFWRKHPLLILVFIGITFLSSHYYHFIYISGFHHIGLFKFFKYLHFKTMYGMIFKSFDPIILGESRNLATYYVGPVGTVIIAAIQTFIIWQIALYYFNTGQSKYLSREIPEIVLKTADHFKRKFILFEEVRPELIKRGWTQKENLDQVEKALYWYNFKKRRQFNKNKKKK